MQSKACDVLLNHLRSFPQLGSCRQSRTGWLSAEIFWIEIAGQANKAQRLRAAVRRFRMGRNQDANAARANLTIGGGRTETPGWIVPGFPTYQAGLALLTVGGKAHHFVTRGRRRDASADNSHSCRGSAKRTVLIERGPGHEPDLAEGTQASCYVLFGLICRASPPPLPGLPPGLQSWIVKRLPIEA